MRAAMYSSTAAARRRIDRLGLRDRRADGPVLGRVVVDFQLMPLGFRVVDRGVGAVGARSSAARCTAPCGILMAAAICSLVAVPPVPRPFSQAVAWLRRFQASLATKPSYRRMRWAIVEMSPLRRLS
jgi:hypothetical protein